MVLKNTGSRISITNLFADFIVSRIPHNEETIIKVVDCKNFFIIKGKTSMKSRFKPMNVKILMNLMIMELN